MLEGGCELWISGREELLVARAATIVICIAAMLLGIAFRGQNLAFIGTLTIAVAGSANFPALLLAIFWRRLTAAGAIAGMLTGLLSSLLLLPLASGAGRHSAARRSGYWPAQSWHNQHPTSVRRHDWCLVGDGDAR